MLEILVESFFTPFAEFGFMRRALLGCVAVAVGATPLGVFLMLRRMSLTGDAMVSPRSVKTPALQRFI